MIAKPEFVLRSGWKYIVDDYAISGGWSFNGEALIICDATGGVYVFNGKSGEIIWSQSNVHEGGILSTAIHPLNNKFLTGGQDGRVIIWNTYQKKNEKVIKLGDGWVENLAWSQDGELFAVSCSRDIYVYNNVGDEIWKSDIHNSTVSNLAWSKNKELATTCYGRVTFFDGTTGKMKQKLEWKGSLVSMVLSPNGDIVACGSQDNTVHFWRRSTEQDSMMSGYPLKPSTLAFDESGYFLATGGGAEITVWSFKGNGPEGTTPLSLKLHTRPITSLAFANRGMKLASGSRDGTVVLWNLKSDDQESGLSETSVSDSVSNLYWRPDDRALAGLDRQGGVTVWRV